MCVPSTLYSWKNHDKMPVTMAAEASTMNELAVTAQGKRDEPVERERPEHIVVR